MDKWMIDLGDVSYWNDEEEKFQLMDMKISYNASDLPYYIEAKDLKRKENTYLYSANLVFTHEDQGLTVLNEDFVLFLTVEQKAMLFDAYGKWKYEPLNPPEKSLEERMPGNYAKDFGIVFYYDRNKEEFILANLRIDFDWSSFHPIIMFVTTYDDDRYPLDIISGQYNSLIYDYKDIIDGLAHYEIFYEHFLLSDKQIELLNYISGLLSKKY